MFTPMLVIAAVLTLVCLAVPVSIWIRMLIDGPRVRSQIHSRMSEVRTAYRTEHSAEADR